MRTKHRRHGAPEEEGDKDEEDVGYVNPMTQPPAVGLTLGKGGSLPKFLFHTQLAATKVSSQLSYILGTSLALPFALCKSVPEYM